MGKTDVLSTSTSAVSLHAVRELDPLFRDEAVIAVWESAPGDDLGPPLQHWNKATRDDNLAEARSHAAEQGLRVIDTVLEPFARHRCRLVHPPGAERLVAIYDSIESPAAGVEGELIAEQVHIVRAVAYQRAKAIAEQAGWTGDPAPAGFRSPM